MYWRGVQGLSDRQTAGRGAGTLESLDEEDAVSTFVIYAPASYDVRRPQTELREAETRLATYAGGHTKLEEIL